MSELAEVRVAVDPYRQAMEAHAKVYRELRDVKAGIDALVGGLLTPAAAAAAGYPAWPATGSELQASSPPLQQQQQKAEPVEEGGVETQQRQHGYGQQQQQRQRWPVTEEHEQRSSSPSSSEAAAFGRRAKDSPPPADTSPVARHTATADEDRVPARVRQARHGAQHQSLSRQLHKVRRQARPTSADFLVAPLQTAVLPIWEQLQTAGGNEASEIDVDTLPFTYSGTTRRGRGGADDNVHVKTHW